MGKWVSGKPEDLSRQAKNWVRGVPRAIPEEEGKIRA